MVPLLTIPESLAAARPGQARAIAFVPKNCRPFIFSFMFD
jgi:hypothetical protein